jgi:hypothetical protein
VEAGRWGKVLCGARNLEWIWRTSPWSLLEPAEVAELPIINLQASSGTESVWRTPLEITS